MLRLFKQINALFHIIVYQAGNMPAKVVVAGLVLLCELPIVRRELGICWHLICCSFYCLRLSSIFHAKGPQSHSGKSHIYDLKHLRWTRWLLRDGKQMWVGAQVLEWWWGRARKNQNDNSSTLFDLDSPTTTCLRPTMVREHLYI